jgi:hypothetical protein
MSLLEQRRESVRNNGGPPTLVANRADPTPPSPAAGEPKRVYSADPLMDLKFRLHERLIRDLDVNKMTGREAKEVRLDVEEAVHQLLNLENTPLAKQDRLRLVTEVANEVLGWALWSRCCRIPRSPRSWSMLPTGCISRDRVCST